MNHRRDLGYSCINESNASEQLKSILKNSINWILRKGKHTVIFIFSKKGLLAAFIFLKAPYIKPDNYSKEFPSYESYIIKLDNLKFSNSSQPTLDLLLKLTGGYSDYSELTDEEKEELLTDKQQKKLLKSVLTKSKIPGIDYIEESFNTEESFNKWVLRISKEIKSKLTDPELYFKIVSSHRFWKIIQNEIEKRQGRPYPNEVGSTETYLPQAKTWYKGKDSSSKLAFKLIPPNTRNLSTIQKKIWLKIAENKKIKFFGKVAKNTSKC